MVERWLLGVWEVLSTFWNSNFGTALISAAIGSLAGAWGGAAAAQRIADRSRRRTQLLDEIRGCNAGIDAVGSILNAFLNLKGQHLLEMKRSYEEHLGAIEVHRLGMEGGWIERGQRLDLRVDQETLPTMRVPVERLERVMLERTTLSGRPQGLASMVLQSVHLANDTIRARNELIDEFKRHPRDELVPLLFALPLPQGRGEDRRYKGCVEGLWKYANDVIYFGLELSRVLTKHGQRIEERFRKRYGDLPLKTSVMLDTPHSRELMPNPADYASWEGTYVALVPPTEGRKWRRRWYAARKAERRLFLKPWGRWKKRQKWRSNGTTAT